MQLSEMTAPHFHHDVLTLKLQCQKRMLWLFFVSGAAYGLGTSSTCQQWDFSFQPWLKVGYNSGTSQESWMFIHLQCNTIYFDILTNRQIKTEDKRNQIWEKGIQRGRCQIWDVPNSSLALSCIKKSFIMPDMCSCNQYRHVFTWHVHYCGFCQSCATFLQRSEEILELIMPQQGNYYGFISF